MNSLIVVLIFTAYLCSPAQSVDCNIGNPCGIDNVYYPIRKGYQCIQLNPALVLCTCPNSGYEFDTPCRPCNRIDPDNNACKNTTGRLFACVENYDYLDSSFACLCSVPGSTTLAATSDANCDTRVTLATVRTTTTTAATLPCLNGGVSVGGICNCPSGFTGPLCAIKDDTTLCDRYRCKAGVCATRIGATGALQAVCLCPYSTSGDFCELNGIAGGCTTGLCLNAGVCRATVIGATRFAYCSCPAGYNGAKCENRYFTCTSVGRFTDLIMYDQGKYFECTGVGAPFIARQLSCPNGLRFNPKRLLCTL